MYGYLFTSKISRSPVSYPGGSFSRIWSHLFGKTTSRRDGTPSPSVRAGVSVPITLVSAWSRLKNHSCHKERRCLFLFCLKAINKPRWSPQLLGECRMNSVWQMVLSSLLPENQFCLSWKQWGAGCVCLASEIRSIFLSLQSLSRLPGIHVTFCFIASSVILLFSLLPFWRGFLDWEKLFVCNHIFPTACNGVGGNHGCKMLSTGGWPHW